MINRDRLLDGFLELVRLDSESGHEGAVKEFLRRRLEEMGLTVTEDNAGRELGSEAGNLVAWLEGNSPGPALMLCSHMDTVRPGTGIKTIMEDGWIRSAGDTILGADDKAGIAAILEALRVVTENGLPRTRLEAVFTVSEEQGLMGSKHLDFFLIKSKIGYVLDASGPVGTIIVEGPFQNEIEVVVRGKAAHAGINPEEGLNAIHLAGKAIARLTLGRIDKDTTCNLGVINGGTARNIVPDEVVVKGEARSIDPGKLEIITREITAAFEQEAEAGGGKCHARVTPLYPGLKLEEDEKVVRLAVAAAREMGLEPRLERTGGGSDANLFNSRGIRCANLGVGYLGPHTVEERIRADDLADNTRFLLYIIAGAVNFR